MTECPGDAGPDLDPALPGRIVAALADCGAGVRRYLELGARLDRVCAVQVGDRAVAWRSLHAAWDRPWIIAMGAEPSAVADCVARLADRTGAPEGLTVDRAAFPLLSPPLRPVAHWEWDWWWTEQAPSEQPGEDRVVDLPLADPRIRDLLRAASPDAMAWPGDRRIRRWAGIEVRSVGDAVPGRGADRGRPADPSDGEAMAADRGAARSDPGTAADPGAADPWAADPPEGPARASTDSEGLAAVAAVTSMRPGIPHLSSVATGTPWRGRGLARALCARITREELGAGAGAVTLGMHAGNRAARALYAALGYRVGYRWASGRL